MSTLVGLSLAARTSGRSRYELLAQAVDEVLPVYRDANGGFYFGLGDLANVPRRETCVVKGCSNDRRILSLGLCQTHYKRYLKGSDLSERIHTEKRRGVAYVPRTARGELMRPVLRPGESETLWSLVGNVSEGVERTGGIHMAATWAYENRQAEKLGTPEMWQEVSDQALERAWADLASGAYEQRLTARLAALPGTSPKAVQSPLVAVAREA